MWPLERAYLSYYWIPCSGVIRTALDGIFVYFVRLGKGREFTQGGRPRGKNYNWAGEGTKTIERL